MISEIQTTDLNFEPDDLDASLDPFAGGTAYGKTIWTPDAIASYLNRSGTAWGTTGKTSDGDASVLNFGFFDTRAQVQNNGYVYALNGGLFGLNEYFGFSAFTPAQRAATREAIGTWDDVIAVNFQETSVDQGDINFGNLTNRPGTQAYARLPSAIASTNPTVNAQVYDIVGDVWVTATTASNFQLDEGLYGMNTLVHEFGHSLGISHPGNYNFAPGFAIVYANGAEYAQDIRNYTIMSYWNPREVGIQDHDYRMGTIAYGSTPMIHDILAAQKMYGADTTTRTGDTTYGFNASADTAGRDSLNFDLTPAPVMTIWDAGGNDTLDASGYTTNQIIDLTPGSMSSIGGVTLADAPSLADVNINRAAAGYSPLSQASYDVRMANLANDPNAGRLVDNVGIAYGTTIENAVGGSGNDVIVGNAATNRLFGGAGNDIISGGAGLDYLTGGSGADTFVGDINGATFDSKRGTLSIDVITDFVSGTDKIDLRGIDANAGVDGDQAFSWQGKSANKDVGDLSFKTFGNINAAENALGIDLDGIDGPGADGKVTVIFGNVDGGTPDFAIVLLGTPSVTVTDFIL